MKLVAAMVLLGAVTLTLVSPAGATNECRGLNPCVAVAGPWVVVPPSGEKAQYQLTCPRGFAVGGTDAELTDRAIDLAFLATSGAPVSPGITTSRTLVFLAAYTGKATRPATFRPHIGCIPTTGGGRRTPTAAAPILPPGAPTVRRVVTTRVTATRRIVASCRANERLVDWYATRGFATPAPPRGRARRLAVGPRARCRGHRGRDRGRPARAGHRAGRCCLRRWTMTFGHPLLLLVLLALPVLAAVYLYLERRPPRYAMTYPNVDLLIEVTRGRQARRYVPPLLALLAVAGLCVALARPHRSTLVPSDDATVVLVIDVSGSMQASDVKPTRLAAAQAAVRKFLDRVPKQVKVGLVAFAGEPQVAAPPTTDRGVVREGLDTLDYFGGYGGTAIGDALAAAVELVKPPPPSGVQTIAYTVAAAPQKKSPVTILFLSDGHQTRGLLQPLEGAARARAAHIPVFTIALGTPNGVLDRGAGRGGWRRVPRRPVRRLRFRGRIPVPPDPATLRAIAQTTGGKFFEARSAKAVSSAYENLGSVVGREPGKREVTWWFVGLAAILLVAAAVFSAFIAPRLP